MQLPIIRHSNLSPILQNFEDTAGFCGHDATPILP